NKYSRRNGFGFYLISNLNEGINKDLIITADILCYVIGELYQVTDYLGNTWYPSTYIYKEGRKIDFLKDWILKDFLKKSNLFLV
ncbi:MAG: hypothetical protein LIP06_06660, partial [Tannerellaceae bacterium]|nr:hypothetical protein [Tannerellaceae bacterium]